MISVCMATYNGERYLAEQLDSILPQLESSDELIISDDGSTDGTVGLIRRMADSRICILENNSRCYTSNFENALRHARGDHIFLSDQDDIWHPDKVKIVLRYLERYDFVMTNARIVDSTGKMLHESRNALLPIGTGFLRNLAKTYYLGCCMAFRRRVLQAALPFPPNRELCLHDAWIALLAELCFRTHLCDECLVDYRMHAHNFSSGAMAITNSFRRMIQIRWYLLKETLRRKRLLGKNRQGGFS